MHLVAAALWLFGCKPPETGVFVGALGALETRIGLVTNEASGRMYVGGGSTTMVDHHEWIDVTIESPAAGKAKLSGASDRFEVVAEYDPSTDDWGGTLTDREVGATTFILQQNLDAGGNETADGPYEAEGGSVGECEVGAVVFGGGDDLRGVYCPQADSFDQVVPVDAIVAGGFDASPASDPTVVIRLVRATP